jgi:Type II secretion system (T2SS), protein M subtype b
LTSKLPSQLLLALLLAIPFGLAFYTIAKTSKTYDQDLGEQLQNYDRIKSIAAYKRVLTKNMAQTETSIHDQLFLPPGTNSIVEAALASQLKQIAMELNVEVSRTGSLPPKLEGTTNLIGETLQISGTTPAIYAFIQQIEMTTPYLFIDRLILRSTTDPTIELQGESTLSAEIDVFGAVKPVESAATP